MTRPPRQAYDPPMRGFRNSGRFLATLLLFLMGAGGAVCAQRHERKRLQRAEILTMESQWRQAQISDDISAMDHLLADDFLGITAAGQVVTKTQQLDRMRSRQLAISRMDMTDTRIKISGSLAVVTSMVRLDGTANGAPLHGSFRYTRVYQRGSGDSWRITHFEATRVPGGTGSYGAAATPPAANASAPPAGAPSSSPASPAGPGSPRPPS